MIRIVLADDHIVVRTGFKMILEQQPDFQVVGEASQVDEALDLVRTLAPDVLISDISMSGEKSGLLLVERIFECNLSLGVVMLTMHEEQSYLLQALGLGVHAYVLKSSSDTELVKAVRRAHDREVFICDAMMTPFVRRTLGGDAGEGELTPRESEIVTLTVKGYSNRDIADTLSISPKTVESQKARIMQKLGLETKPQLFDYAHKHGLLA